MVISVCTLTRTGQLSSLDTKEMELKHRNGFPKAKAAVSWHQRMLQRGCLREGNFQLDFASSLQNCWIMAYPSMNILFLQRQNFHFKNPACIQDIMLSPQNVLVQCCSVFKYVDVTKCSSTKSGIELMRDWRQKIYMIFCISCDSTLVFVLFILLKHNWRRRALLSVKDKHQRC